MTNDEELKTMGSSFKEAAVKVLRVAKKPLSAEDITRHAMSEGWLKTEGATPAATMAAQLYIDIRDNSKSPFIKVKAGLFDLKTSSDESDGLAHAARHNESIKKVILDYLMKMDPKHFEFLIGALLEKIGFEDVEVTGQSGDKGIDLTAKLTVGGVTDVKTVVQVKRHKGNIQAPDIRNLRGSAELNSRALIITTSDFAKGAEEEARQANKVLVSLVNGEKLVDLLIKHEVGVKKTVVDILSLDEEYMNTFMENSSARLDSRDSSKSLSIWPLPGGYDQYLNTLVSYLKFVRSKKPTISQAVKWFMDNYEQVASENTARSYTGVPRSLGLSEAKNGKFLMTVEGEKFLDNPIATSLKDVLEANIAGTSEIIELLEDKPQSEKEILNYVNDSIGFGWQTTAQVKFRLLWLMNAEVVRKNDDGKYQVKGK